VDAESRLAHKAHPGVGDGEGHGNLTRQTVTSQAWRVSEQNSRYIRTGAWLHPPGAHPAPAGGIRATRGAWFAAIVT
jgi:hypothetical protein